MTGAPAPSGEQIELAAGDQRAVVVGVGGGLRSYSAGGRELLDGYGAGEASTSGRGQVLIPWPNRLEDGSYEFDGRRLQLPLTEPANRNAIHGLVRGTPWTAAEREPHRVALEHTLHAQDGYPFTLALRVEYALADGGLAVRATARNLGGGPAPYGCGFHPYLAVADGPVDPLVLRVPGCTVVLCGARGLPAASVPVGETELDFQKPRPIGATVLDNTFTDLERDADGLARAVLRDPASGRGLELWADEAFGYLQVFTGDPLPDVARRSLAVEPMTCPANAFRTGEALIRLEPGASHTAAWGLRPTAGG